MDNYFQLGYNAFMSGKSMNDHPEGISSEDYDDWFSGWCMAQTQSQK